MGLFSWPKQWFVRVGSGLAIFMVRRRLRKRPRDAGIWLLLARLYEVRQEPAQADKVLRDALKLLPGNKVLEAQLKRLRTSAKI